MWCCYPWGRVFFRHNFSDTGGFVAVFVRQTRKLTVYVQRLVYSISNPLLFSSVYWHDGLFHCLLDELFKPPWPPALKMVSFCVPPINSLFSSAFYPIRLTRRYGVYLSEVRKAYGSFVFGNSTLGMDEVESTIAEWMVCDYLCHFLIFGTQKVFGSNIIFFCCIAIFFIIVED